ncbi:MAG: SIMPL domain-containing protein [Actinomycetota bacterium]|nr:SIMPL domain-containing protein [Actinomycetota bacterium]
MTVEATGSVKVVPDGVQFNFSVFAVEATSSSALERANKLASQAREALDDSKINKDDIATQSVSIYPEYSYAQDGAQTLSGFRATQIFAVTLRDTTSAGEEKSRALRRIA